MTTSFHKETILLQTVIELDSQISNLSHLISENKYLEVGDDPGLVRKVENTLVQVYSKIKLISPYFDLRVMSLRKANYYFDLMKRVDEAIVYLQEIKRRDYGSRQHTKELLDKLQNCSKSLFAISDVIDENVKVIH